ncbi:MAG: phosphomannomutase/phosphoglucomutase [Clostridia bacterium]|nr:phosphomannomutase/phosphoglucomutase [Clostridia bacterium]
MKYAHLKSGTDIRGVAGGNGIAFDAPITLTPEISKQCAAAFAGFLKEKYGKEALTVAVGHDCRVSSPDIAAAAEQGLCEAGVRVLRCGYATTPSMFFATRFAGSDCDGAIEITASHLPPERNGLKFFTKEGGLEGKDITAILSAAETVTPAPTPGQIIPFDILTPYSEELIRLIRARTGKEMPFAGQKIIVNAGNGMGGFFEKNVLRPLGADTVGSVNLTPDGTFPVHIPNPENAAAMEHTARATVAAGATLGICFDTDCDRAAVVDGEGRSINSSALIALISAILLEETPGITVVTDSVTSSGLAEFIAAKGGKHHRFKRGYKNVIDEAIRLEKEGISAPLAIETSGHAALKENCFLDDGAYLVVRLLCKLAEMGAGHSLTELIAELKEAKEAKEIRLTITREDFRAHGESVLAAFESFITRYGTIELPSFEGVRVNFDEDHGAGWILMRLSVHDPVLPINIESDKEGGVAVIEGYLREFLTTQTDLK